MRKFTIACVIVAVGVVALVLKINYEQNKSDREMEQQGKSMCENKVINCNSIVDPTKLPDAKSDPTLSGLAP